MGPSVAVSLIITLITKAATVVTVVKRAAHRVMVMVMALVMAMPYDRWGGTGCIKWYQNTVFNWYLTFVMNSKQFRYNVCLSAYFTRRQKRWSSYTIIVMCTCSAFKASRWICKLVHLITKSKKFIYIVQTINIHIIYTLRNDLKPI